MKWINWCSKLFFGFVTRNWRNLWEFETINLIENLIENYNKNEFALRKVKERKIERKRGI